MKARPIRVEGDVAYVPLSQGYEAVIDASDASLVEGFNWCAMVSRNTVYAVRHSTATGKDRLAMMHRAIAKTPDGIVTDHINGNGLDNRRSNLRYATVSQNAQNSGFRANNTSGVRGVCWDTARQKWIAQIWVNGKNRCKRFATIDAAAAWYADMSANLHGDFGRIK